jgi:hypothetical protein
MTLLDVSVKLFYIDAYPLNPYGSYLIFVNTGLEAHCSNKRVIPRNCTKPLIQLVLNLFIYQNTP